MAATVSFSVGAKRTLTLLPKDAIVTAGSQRLVYVVANDKVAPVSINVIGYHDNDAAVKGDLKPGQQVAGGDPIAVIEAMKMLHTLAASGPGVVADVWVAPGDQVDSNHVLVTFETEDAAP